MTINAFNRSAVGLKARNAAAHKPKGNGYVPTAGLAGVLGCSLKTELEAPFDAVRIVKWSTQLASGQNWKTLVAATETADTSTTTNRWTPVVGGVSYNALRSSTDTYGWTPVTFGGKHPYNDTPALGVIAACPYTIVSNVVTVTLPAQDPPLAAGQKITVFDQTASGIPRNEYTLIAGSNATTAKFALTHADASSTCFVIVGSPFEKPGMIVSDLIACPSVPRADGGTRPLLLIRSAFDGTQGVPGDCYNVGATDDAPTARNRGRINQLGTSTSDIVASLGTNPSGSSNWVHPLFVIPYYRTRVVSVAVVGDSTHESTFLATDKASSWLARACYDVSTPELPVVPYNLGMGSGTPKMFTGFARQAFAITKPDILFYQIFSVNDFGGANPTQRMLDDAFALAQDFLDYCLSMEITVILTTPMPNEAYTYAGDTLRRQARARICELAKARGLAHVDFSFIGDDRSPEKFRAEFRDSGVHENDYALDPMAAACSTVLRQFL